MATQEKAAAMAAEKKAEEMEFAKVAESAKVAEPEEADVLPEEDLPTDLDGMENTGLMVSRRLIRSTKKKGETIWIYFTSGILRGREVQAQFQAPDVGGYSLLDLAFDGAKAVPLWRKAFENRDNEGKITLSGYHYYAVSYDDDGMIYLAQVKPSAKSDKSFLEALIKKLQLENERLRKEGDVASEG